MVTCLGAWRRGTQSLAEANRRASARGTQITLRRVWSDWRILAGRQAGLKERVVGFHCDRLRRGVQGVFLAWRRFASHAHQVRRNTHRRLLTKAWARWRSELRKRRTEEQLEASAVVAHRTLSKTRVLQTWHDRAVRATRVRVAAETLVSVRGGRAIGSLYRSVRVGSFGPAHDANALRADMWAHWRHRTQEQGTHRSAVAEFQARRAVRVWAAWACTRPHSLRIHTRFAAEEMSQRHRVAQAWRGIRAAQHQRITARREMAADLLRVRHTCKAVLRGWVLVVRRRDTQEQAVAKMAARHHGRLMRVCMLAWRIYAEGRVTRKADTASGACTRIYTHVRACTLINIRMHLHTLTYM
jgi:hypothetical protein